MKRHFELVEGNSSKFWEISTAGNDVTVRFGRIGTNGQTQTKDLCRRRRGRQARREAHQRKDREGLSGKDFYFLR